MPEPMRTFSQRIASLASRMPTSLITAPPVLAAILGMHPVTPLKGEGSERYADRAVPGGGVAGTKRR
jgi:hypothetical protein